MELRECVPHELVLYAAGGFGYHRFELREDKGRRSNDMRGMLYRAFMAARFHRATYRDVLRDQQAVLNALGIVILAGIAYAVGQSSAVGEAAEQGLDAGAIGDRLLGAWFASITFMVGWLIWAGIAYGVGRVFQRDEATFREILRVLGICFGPALLLFLTAITPIEGVVFNFVTIWMLVAGIIALQEIRQSDWLGAILDCSLGWVVGLQLLPAVLLTGFFDTIETIPEM